MAIKAYDIRGGNLASGSIDYSYLLDAPAGKHGFLTVRDGHFYFEDGTRIRFMGTNLVFGGGTPDRDVAENIAERLARSGVNMVRFHHIDSISGAFTDPPRSIVDYRPGHSKELLAEGIDKLDYMVYQLKIHGIYIHIDLMTLRTFLPGDGLDYPDLLNDGYDGCLKNITLFNKRLQQLHKRYMKQYLQHLNPYTGLRYVDEPAVAIVQMVNEDSIFYNNRIRGHWFPSYMQELDRRWNQYLLDKYHDRAGLDGAWTNDLGKHALMAYEDPALMNVVSPGIGSNGYELHSEYDAPFDGPQSPVRIAEHKAFLSQLENEYSGDMDVYLRNLGVKCCIDISNLPLGVADLECVAKGDLTEINMYWNHPQRARGDRGNPPVYHHEYQYNNCPYHEYPGRFNTFKLNAITNNAVAKVKDKPIIVSEWNAPHPTLFRADVVLMQTAYACLQDWDGLLLFSYTHSGDSSLLERTHIASTFDSATDPVMWGLMGLTSAIFQQNLISVARNLIDVCYTDVDKFNQPNSNYQLPFRTAPFISRVQANYIEETYQGDADLAVSSGFTATGDYTAARHALVYSRSSYGDMQQKENTLSDFLARHRNHANIKVVEDGRIFDQDDFAFYRELSKALSEFGLSNHPYISDQNALVSDTGELTYDYKGGAFTANAPQIAIYVGDGGEHSVGPLSLSIRNARMSVSALSKDGKPIGESDHLLINAIGDCSNSNMVWDGDKLLSEGTAPVLIDTFEGSVTIPQQSSSCTVQALNDKGEPIASLPTVKTSDGWKVDFDGCIPAMYFKVRFA